MTNLKAVSQSQKIIVNSSTMSVSIINAGPPGPRGYVGPHYNQFVQDDPPVAIYVGDQWFNTTNGRQYVWYDNFWVEIGNSLLGSGGMTVDGNLPTRVGGSLGEITRANLAADSGWASRYPQVINHGATAGTARVGTAPTFWIGSVDPTNATNNDSLYRTDTKVYYIRVSGAWLETGFKTFAATRCRRITTSPIPSNALTPVSWTIEDIDVAGLITIAGAIFTIPAGYAGQWSIDARITLASAINARNFLSIEVTSAITGSTGSYRQSSYGEDTSSIHRIIPLAVGDVFHINAFQLSGSAVNLTTANIQALLISL